MISLEGFRTASGAVAIAAGVLYASTAAAQTSVIVGSQQIVGPFLSAIADGSFDQAVKEAGYEVDWRQFSSAGDISAALASGNMPIGVLGSTGITAATTRGVDLELFWILDNIGKSEALVAREGSQIESPDDLKGRNVGVPFVSTSHFHLLVGMDRVWNIDPREVNILNMQPPQIVAAWQRGDIDAAYVWPPALSEILKSGKAIADSEQIGAASVPTFDGIVQGIVQMIGGNPDDVVQALNLLVFPTVEEQASDIWLGGGAESGAAQAFSESASFLVEQKQIDQALDDYSVHVNGTFAAAAAQ